MTKLFFEMNTYDIDTRITNEGRVPLVPLVHVHELSDGGPVKRDEDARVAATLVQHPRVVPAFAYRFDGADRSIVISGDTTPSDNLLKLARVQTCLCTPCFTDRFSVVCLRHVSQQSLMDSPMRWLR